MNQNDQNDQDGPINPFSPEALLDDDPDDGYGSEETLLSVDVRKPHKDKFLRGRTGKDEDGVPYSKDFWMLEVVDGLDKTYFWLSRDLVGPLQDSGIATPTRKRLVLCSDQFGSPFLWPLTINTSGNPNKWSASALRIYNRSLDMWVRCVPHKRSGEYQCIDAQGRLGDPIWPKQTFSELLSLALEERMITSEDHEVIRRLRGLPPRDDDADDE